MQRNTPDVRAGARGFAACALVTIAALYLVWAAFHDIAHGEADVTNEHTVLVVSAVWFVFLGLVLLSARQPLLGVVSLVAVGAGLWGQSVVGASDAAKLSPKVLAISAAFVWFVILAAILGLLSCRAGRKAHKVAEA